MTTANLTDACGWTLVHFVWQGAAIGLWLGCALAAIPAARVQARYLAGCLALLTMVVAAGVTFTWQASSVVSPSTSQSALADATSTPNETSALVANDTEAEPEMLDVWGARAHDGGAAARTSARTTNWLAAAHQALTPWLHWLVGMWALGATVLWTRLVNNWRGVHQLRASGRPLEHALWLATLARLATALGVRSKVALLESAKAHVPMVIGWLRPVILVPAKLVTGLTAAELEAILAHELAHIRRYDYLVNLLQNLAETVLFFHPAVWWTSGRIRRERECCCDLAAARACNGAVRYARALLAIESMRGQPGLAMAATGGSLLDRVRRLAGQESRSPQGAFGTMAAAGVVALAIVLGMGVARTSAVDRTNGVAENSPSEEESKDGPLTDDEAKALAVRAHEKAAALNDLPRLYYEVSYRNGDVETMGAEDAYSLQNLQKAFDEPVKEDKWIQVNATIAWDPRRLLLDTYYPSLKSSDGSSSDYHQIYFGDKSEGWAREEYGNDPAKYFRRPNVEALWSTSSPMAFKFLAATPRRFWWGDTLGHNLGHNPVPPAMVDYRHLGREDFDGEACDVVESKGRAERLWISQDTGLIRGCMEYIFQGRMDTELHQSPVVERVAGRTFASSKEYRQWHQENAKSLTDQQRAELSKVFFEGYFDEMAKESSLIIFSDYREIAPGVWLPFSEDRTSWLHHPSDDDKYKYIRCETRVTKAAVDVDLEAKVTDLAPTAGARVQDQRFEGAVVEYPWRDDLTAEEIDSLVQAKRLELDDSRRLIEELRAPMAKLVRQAAPVLPDDGWIGKRPQLDGKPYLIHFWATWCGPCKNDYELLNRVAKNRQIIGVHPAGTPRKKIEAAAKDGQHAYPTLIATKTPEELVGGYPVKMYPYCVVVDAEGKVAAHGGLSEVAEAFGDLHQ